MKNICEIFYWEKSEKYFFGRKISVKYLYIGKIFRRISKI
jgi:hypothetical protein